jgi:hypothetical protein
MVNVVKIESMYWATHNSRPERVELLRVKLWDARNVWQRLYGDFRPVLKALAARYGKRLISNADDARWRPSRIRRTGQQDWSWHSNKRRARRQRTTIGSQNLKYRPHQLNRNKE